VTTTGLESLSARVARYRSHRTRCATDAQSRMRVSRMLKIDAERRQNA